MRCFVIYLADQAVDSQDLTNVSQPVQIVSTTMADSITSILMPPPAQPAQNLPPGCPTWAARLKDCEVGSP